MAFRTIVTKGKDRCIFKEGFAGEILTPGHLLQGLPADLLKHAVAAGTAIAMFAVENELAGKEIGDTYADLEGVRYVIAPPGTEIAAIADGTGVTAGDIVESNGDGTFQVQAASAATAQGSRHSVVGRALTTAAADARFTLEVF